MCPIFVVYRIYRNMARTSKDQPILTPTARKKLGPRDNAYFKRVTDLMSVGYRRSKVLPGSWTVRMTDANGKYSQHRLPGVADDIERPNGRDVLNFDQAVALARQKVNPAPVNPESKDLTVEAAIDMWVDKKVVAGTSGIAEGNLRSAAKAMAKFYERKHVKDLTVRDVERFRDNFLVGFPHDRLRARRSTANRALANLKAALNFAADREMPDAPRPWAMAEKFSKAESFGKRVIVCTPDQEDALYRACPTAEAENLWRAGFLTGCRLGELMNADVGHLTHRRLEVAGKTGQRKVVLSNKATEFFVQLAATTNDPNRPLFLDEHNERWRKNRLDTLLRKIIRNAEGIEPGTTFYSCRHTY